MLFQMPFLVAKRFSLNWWEIIQTTTSIQSVWDFQISQEAAVLLNDLSTPRAATAIPGSVKVILPLTFLVLVRCELSPT